jgi:hypothetical protein
MARSVSGNKTSDLACLECVVVKNVRFSITGMCSGQKSQIQHGRNALLGKMSNSAWLKCVIERNVRFSIARMCCGQNVRFNMARMFCDQKRQI